MQRLYAIALHTFSLIVASLSGHIPNPPTTPIDHGAAPLDWQSSCPVQSVNYFARHPPPTCAAISFNNALPLSTVAHPRSTGPIEGLLTLSEEVAVIKTVVSATPVPHDTSSSGDISSTSSTTSPSPILSVSDISSSLLAVEKDAAEGDPSFDLTNFLSFEEWKKQNLAKGGQAAESVGQRTVKHSGEGQGRPDNNNGLDSYGDDAEIDIDFSGFGRQQAKSEREEHPYSDRNENAEKTKKDAEKGATKVKVEPTAGHPRSKDAGKTCKERSNYASFDCAATVLKTNPESKGANSILVENKDSYMLNKCAASNKFFIVELCNDILIDTIVLANYEFFSSMFRTFRVSVSDRYPVKLDKWKEVGTYQARNTREIQAFLVENPLIWAKYVRVEFLTQYGNEYYCPVSLFRVHGTTMMEEFNHEMKVSRGEEEGEGENEDEVLEGDPKAIVVDPLPTSTEEMTSTSIGDSDHSGYSETANSEGADTLSSSQHLSTASTSSEGPPYAPVCQSLELVLFSASSSKERILEHQQRNRTSLSATQVSSSAMTESYQLPSPIHFEQSSISGDSASNTTSTTTSQGQVTSLSVPPSGEDITNSTSSVSMASNATAPLSSMPTSTPTFSVKTSASELNHISAILTNTSSTHSLTDATSAPTSSSSPPPSSKASSIPRPTPSSSPPPTQESFFKSVHKRLQLLESNSTLSLQYIESQSLLLRDAFSRFEKRQINKTTAFLGTLNATVLGELNSFRNQYETLLMESIREMGAQSLDAQRQIQLLAEGLRDAKRDMYWQQRIAVLQFTALMMGFGFVFLTRQMSSPTSHMNGHSPDHYPSDPRIYANGYAPNPDTATAVAAYETPPSSASPASTSPRFSWFRRGSPSPQKTSPPLKRPSLKREKTLPALPPNDGLPSPSPTPSPEPPLNVLSSPGHLIPPTMANGDDWPLRSDTSEVSDTDDLLDEDGRFRGKVDQQTNGIAVMASDPDEEMRRPQSGPI